MKNFHAITLSYKRCPLKFREVFSFNDEQVKSLLNAITEMTEVNDLLIISTCNRTEIYYTAAEEKSSTILKIIGLKVGLLSMKFSYYFNLLDGKAAVFHLYKVALGLDSMILGDMQIINQIKRAYQLAADKNTMGPFGHRLLHSIFQTNKRVNLETTFREGNTSLASAAVGRAKAFAQQFKQPKIIILGLGEIGTTIAENLKKFHGDVVVINRTSSKATSIAERYGYIAAPISELNRELAHAHVIISAARCEKPLINTESLIAKTNRHQLYIDLSVPRSIDQSVARVTGVHLINVDKLAKQTESTLRKRESKLAEVSAIIEESMLALSEWSENYQFSPVIKQLKAALESIRKEEISRYLNEVDTDSAEIIDIATKNIIQKIIKLPVLQLKNGCKRDEAKNLTQSLIDLFDLTVDPVKIKGLVLK